MSPYQNVSQVARTVGTQPGRIYFPDRETYHSHVITQDRVSLLLTVTLKREQALSTVTYGAGMRLVSWQRVSGTWVRQKDVKIVSPLRKPQVLKRYVTNRQVSAQVHDKKKV
jgi:hypothetical protein